MKWIKKLFILSVFLPLFMFKNTSAVEYTTLLKPVKTGTVSWRAEYKQTESSSWQDLAVPFQMTTSSDLSTAQNSERYLGKIYSTSNVNLVKNHYYEIYIALYTDEVSHDPLGIFWTIINDDNFKLVSIKEELKQNDTSFEHWMYSGSNFVGSGETTSYNGQYNLYTLTLQATKTTSAPLVIGRSGQITLKLTPPTDIFYRLQPYILVRGTYAEFEALEDEAAEVLEEMNDKDEQDRSDIESQSDSTDSEADSAGNAAESTGTSLFSAFTQLLTALTSVNGNSCTLPRMQVYSLDFGRMNLCQFDIPPQIMALVSIGMVFIIIPLGINLVKRMISLYKEITG